MHQHIKNVIKSRVFILLNNIRPAIKAKYREIILNISLNSMPEILKKKDDIVIEKNNDINKNGDNNFFLKI
ncbi:TPA: hypothetical protein ACKRDV_001689 [Proteus mirabilis]